MRGCLLSVLSCAMALLAGSAGAQQSLRGTTIRINRATGPITIDGDLSDEGWRGATRVDRWYEINPGDNVEPKVRNVGYLAYDDRYFYAAFDLQDPDPSSIRAPYSDRDAINGNYTDFAGVIVDTRNDGHSGVEFFATPRGIQYDAVTDDAGNGEDSSPDFFWESAGRITSTGWTLEIKIPFSSLRYRNVDPQTWGILLYRNYPREFRYQFFSAKVPRGSNCFICRANSLVGLEHLPSGGHVTAAPYVNSSESATPIGDPGTPLHAGSVHSHVGADVKWTPNADNAVDLTVKPDFSQVESDTAQIAANERFALFYPEKRPFFLEGVELFSTPIQAVYTRTITAPRWGSRVTGKAAGLAYTALVAEDAGGGSAILPGSNGSDLAPQDFSSQLFVARVRRDIRRSFVSVLTTDREAGANGHSRVIGPDFLWRPSADDAVTGQWLWSDTRNPNRTDLSDAWTGQPLSGHGAMLQYQRNTTHFDLTGQYKDFSDGFRADTGFVPQVGYRETYGETGWTFRPHGLLSRLRTFLITDRQVDGGGALISREISPGAGMDARWSSFLRFRYANDRVRAGANEFDRQQFLYIVQTSPSRLISQIAIDGRVGQEIDFANSRPGRGSTLTVSASVHPTEHLELRVDESDRRLDVDAGAGRQRLFTARASRLRGTYTFNARTFARVIGQYISTARDPSLYLTAVDAHDGSFTGSALFAFKLNWQSVLFLGYGDDRTITDADRVEQTGRQLFVKISYAFQR